MRERGRLKPRLGVFRHKGRLRGLQTTASPASALAVTGRAPGQDSASPRRRASPPSAALRRDFSRQPSPAITARADFSAIRYAQCWEDADTLLAGLDVQPGDSCLSIASAGDNTLALLARSPGHVLALDVSDAQLACLALRVAAYRALEHHELLELIGSRPSPGARTPRSPCSSKSITAAAIPASAENSTFPRPTSVRPRSDTLQTRS